MAKFLDSLGLGTLWAKLKTQAQGYVNTHAADTEAHKALLAGKADLDPATGKVKPEQLPPIKTDQVVEQAEAPTSPDTILWVDTDEETPGVDIEGIRAEAELAHTTADSAITMINAIEESITQIENKNDAQDTAITGLQTSVATNTEAISKNTSDIAALKAAGYAEIIRVSPDLLFVNPALDILLNVTTADGINVYVDVAFNAMDVVTTGNTLFALRLSADYPRVYPATISNAYIFGYDAAKLGAASMVELSVSSNRKDLNINTTSAFTSGTYRASFVFRLEAA